MRAKSVIIKVMKKLGIRILVILIMCAMLPLNVVATTISDVKKQQKETQKKLDNANEEIEALTETRKGITDEINQIDDEIVEVMASISILEDEIEETEAAIEVKKVELQEAIETETEQYESMKTRIKFMYEKGELNYAQLMLESRSMADMINKVDYANNLYQYDRGKLDEYIAAKEATAAAKAALEEEQEELETAHYELEMEKADLDLMLEEKKLEAEDYDTQIAKAKQDAAAYKAKIKQQNNQIRKLEEEERKRKEEERKRKEAEAKKKAEEAALNGENTDGEGNSSEEGNSENSSDSSSGDSNSDNSSSGNDSSSNSGSNNSTPVSSSGSGKGQEIANFACKFVGNPYVAGGTSLTQGADCSGFTMAVYKEFGYNLPRSSTSQRSAGTGVTYAEAQPGDIICYAGHVAIYIGNGQIVHASTPSSGIKIGNATYKQILAVRRIV